jgi:hypothetical protein
MVCFQTKNPNLGKCLRALHRLENVDLFYGHLEYLRTFGILCDHLVLFVLIWSIFYGFGYHAPKKSGNPVTYDNTNSQTAKQWTKVGMHK